MLASPLGTRYVGDLDHLFDTYRSLRMHEMPVVDVHVVPSQAAPGQGELIDVSDGCARSLLIARVASSRGTSVYFSR